LDANMSLADLAASYNTAKRENVPSRVTNSIAEFAATNSIAEFGRSTNALAAQQSALRNPVGADNIRSVTNNAARPLSIADDLDRRLSDDRASWEHLSRATKIGLAPNIEHPPIIVDIPDLVEDFTEALEARAGNDRELLTRQAEALGQIVEAGKAQNGLMTEIVTLQQMLVKEALENSRVQRVVLYFTALSAALAIFALLK